MEAMWNRVVFLLGITVYEDELKAHVAQMTLMSGWLRVNYPELTCEEVCLAYDLACQRQLKIEELFSILTAKHVGIVLNAYRQFTSNDMEINRVFVQQLLLNNEPVQPTAEEINQLMETELTQAIAHTKEGKFYYDTGNGLFDWLYNQQRISLTEDESDLYYEKAKKALPKLLKREQKLIMGQGGKLGQITQLLEQAKNQQYNDDHEMRLQGHAKRLYLNDLLKSLPDGQRP